MRRIQKPGKPPSERRADFDRQPPRSLVKIAREAARRAGVDPANRKMLVVGTRVGKAEHLPPNYHPAPCSGCSKPVWVNGDFIMAFEVIPLCTACLGGR